MAIVADFLLVWLPAPTVALRPPLSLGAGPISKFFFTCPDNAFQIALGGTSYSLIQRLGAIAQNGAKLFAVRTSASLVGTGVTNALIKARTAVDKSFEGDAEQIHVLQTSVAYGVYMAVSSNLRYQILVGVLEQRVLEPLLHQHKILLIKCTLLCCANRKHIFGFITKPLLSSFTNLSSSLTSTRKECASWLSELPTISYGIKNPCITEMRY